VVQLGWSKWIAPRLAAAASAVLLALFGIAMAISLGLKSLLNYSVFSACGAALLLALFDAPRPKS